MVSPEQNLTLTRFSTLFAETIPQLASVFDLLDTNGDGEVSEEEFTKAVEENPALVQALWHALPDEQVQCLDFDINLMTSFGRPFFARFCSGCRHITAPCGPHHEAPRSVLRGEVSGAGRGRGLCHNWGWVGRRPAGHQPW